MLRTFVVRALVHVLCFCFLDPPLPQTRHVDFPVVLVLGDTTQVMLALVLLHQSVAAQEDTPRADQSPNVVKATIQVPHLIVAHRRV